MPQDGSGPRISSYSVICSKYRMRIHFTHDCMLRAISFSITVITQNITKRVSLKYSAHEVTHCKLINNVRYKNETTIVITSRRRMIFIIIYCYVQCLGFSQEVHQTVPVRARCRPHRITCTLIASYRIKLAYQSEASQVLVVYRTQ